MSRFVAIPGGRDAYEQAVHLRQLGLSYPAIRTVLRDYHGIPVNVSTLRTNCRRRGVAPAPRGLPIHERLRAAA
jgi:hypothetical protein